MANDTKDFLIVVLIVWNLVLTLLVVGLANDMWGRVGLIARFGRMQ